MNKKTQGIIFILLAAVGFAFMNLFVKLAGDIPAIQKSFFRNLVAAIVAFTILIRNKVPMSFGNGGAKYVFWRSLVGTIGIFANFYAIGKLCISDASMLNKLSPFWAILFSFILIKEKIKPYQLICIITALAGAMFILKPGIGSLTSLPGLIGLIGGACAGFAYTNVRLASLHQVPGPFIVFCFSTFSCLSALPYCIIVHAPMSPMQLFYLIMAGVSATVGQFSITTAYSYAPAKDISIYDYSQIIFAAILGFIFLGEVPDLMSYIGYVIIISASIVMFLINRKNS